MDIGILKNWSMFASFCFIFFETSMCLCRIVSGNVVYMKKCFKTHNKNKEKTKCNGFICQNTGILLDFT